MLKLYKIPPRQDSTKLCACLSFQKRPPFQKHNSTTQKELAPESGPFENTTLPRFGGPARRQWATLGAGGARFGLIVHHADAEREYAYDRQSHFGKLDVALDAAAVNRWTVVDMKNDWKRIFPSTNTNPQID